MDRQSLNQWTTRKSWLVVAKSWFACLWPTVLEFWFGNPKTFPRLELGLLTWVGPSEPPHSKGLLVNSKELRASWTWPQKFWVEVKLCYSLYLRLGQSLGYLWTPVSSCQTKEPGACQGYSNGLWMTSSQTATQPSPPLSLLPSWSAPEKARNLSSWVAF